MSCGENIARIKEKSRIIIGKPKKLYLEKNVEWNLYSSLSINEMSFIVVLNLSMVVKPYRVVDVD